MARQKRQEPRRRELMAAAARAILERGVAGLRVRDVATEAGRSAGLVSYYYRDLDDLLLDVHQDAVDRFHHRRAAAVEELTDPRQRLIRLVAEGLPATAEDTLCRLLYEIHVHAARSRTHAALLTALWDREVALYGAVLQHGYDLGVFALRSPVAAVAANAVALEEAYGLHVVARNTSVPPERARDLVLRFLEGETGCRLRAASI